MSGTLHCESTWRISAVINMSHFMVTSISLRVKAFHFLPVNRTNIQSLKVTQALCRFAMTYTLVHANNYIWEVHLSVYFLCIQKIESKTATLQVNLRADKVEHKKSNSYLEGWVLLQDRSTWEVLHITIAPGMLMLRWLIVDLRTCLSSGAANTYIQFHVFQSSVSQKYQCLVL